MASAVKKNVEEWKTKLDLALHEQNMVTNLLEKIETKTGVKRLHLALGGWSIYFSIYLLGIVI